VSPPKSYVEPQPPGAIFGDGEVSKVK